MLKHGLCCPHTIDAKYYPILSVFLGGGGGIGIPSATTTPMARVFLGGGGGMGMPSATTEFKANPFFGGGGGMGIPSATAKPVFQRGNVEEWLTVTTAKSTIRLTESVKTRTRKLFGMGALLAATMQPGKVLGECEQKKFRCRNWDTYDDMLQQMQQHREILFSLTAQYLEPLRGNFERLAYLAGLRDPSTGLYHHERLSVVYGEEAVCESLRKCHEELFEKILESPLSRQEQDLVIYLQSQASGGEAAVGHLEDSMQAWIPPKSPDYLKDLFCSNLRALHQLMDQRRSRAHLDR